MSLNLQTIILAGATGPGSGAFATFNVGNPEDIGNTFEFADEAALPAPSLANQNKIFYAKAENTYLTVNLAGGAYQKIAFGTGAGTVITDTVKTFVFTAATIVDFDISVLSKVCLILGTRLYISDPKTQEAISRNYTLSLFPNADRKASEVYLGFKGKSKFVYTQLVNATAVASKDFTVDDIDEMTFDDPIAFLGDIVAGIPVTDIGTLFNTINDPNSVPPQTEDDVGRIYPINNGVVNVGQFKDKVFSDDGEKIFGRLELQDVDTFDVKFEIKAASV